MKGSSDTSDINGLRKGNDLGRGMVMVDWMLERWDETKMMHLDPVMDIEMVQVPPEGNNSNNNANHNANSGRGEGLNYSPSSTGWNGKGRG